MKKIMLAVALAVPALAQASNWITIGRNNDGAFHLDMQSIYRQGEIATYQTKRVFNDTQVVSGCLDCNISIPYNREIELDRVNCQTGRMTRERGWLWLGLKKLQRTSDYDSDPISEPTKFERQAAQLACDK